MMTPAYIEWHDSRLDELRWLSDGSACINLASILVYTEKGKEHFGIHAWEAVLMISGASIQNGLSAFSPGERVSDGAIFRPDGSELELALALEWHDCAAIQITLQSGETLNMKGSSVKLELVNAVKTLKDWYGPLES